MPDIQLQDVTLRYEVAGEGQPLLFLNGLGMSLEDWDSQAAFFSKEYHVIRFDYRGQGESDKPPGPYSIPLFCEDAANLLHRLNAGPANLVGLSMGGMVAFQMAVSHPGLLRSMVIVNSGPELVLRNRRQKFEFLKRRLIVRMLGMRTMAKILAGSLFPEKGQEKLRDEITNRWARNDKDAYIQSFMALMNWSVSERLGEIRRPTLIVSADRDYTPVSFKKAYADRMPDAELVVISNSRHATPMDQPEKFNNIVADFLKRRG